MESSVGFHRSHVLDVPTVKLTSSQARACSRKCRGSSAKVASPGSEAVRSSLQPRTPTSETSVTERPARPRVKARSRRSPL